MQRPSLILSHFLLAICVLCFAVVTPVHAYLDPGTGSFILQMILGGLAGVALLVRVYWQKFLAFFRGETGNENAEAGERHGESD